MPRTAAIIQARMASTRLPGKVLLKLAGRTVLEHIITRARAISGIDVVCCAVPESAESDAVAREAARCGAEVFRGPDQDVLARYFGAACMLKATTILRVTSDCPLIDPKTCAAVIRLREDTASDYACNNMPPTFPHGLDCEAFTLEILQHAASEARLPAEREHVTPWMRTHPKLRRVNLADPHSDGAGLRWTLDYPEDFAFFTALFRYLPSTAIPTTAQVRKVLTEHPELATINARRHDLGRPTALTQGAP